MDKSAAAHHKIHELLRQRWSPRAFADQSVQPHELRSLFEAARWAASGYNEQPWRYLVARREEREQHKKLLDCLVEGNQIWAKRAPVLALSVVRTTYRKTGKPNRLALHDVGLALAQLMLQATALGLVIHPMGGIDAERARATFGIPEQFEPVVALAMGRLGAAETLPEGLQPAEGASRVRRPQSEFVFAGSWGTALEFPEDRSWQEVLDFWLGELDDSGLAPREQSERWFQSDAQFDEQIVARFASLYEDIVRGRCEAWRQAARGSLAYVIVLDQFARNMFRDTPKMFAADAQALRAALEAVTLGLDRALGAHERVFLILPTMHSEQLAVQQQGVQLFSELRDQLEGQPREVVSRHLDYAIRHRDIIARFGRFPHRNAILGRESTREELEFLQRPGASR